MTNFITATAARHRSVQPDRRYFNQTDRDAYQLADWFTDARLLSELTAEEWIELGFYRNGDVWSELAVPFVGVEYGVNSKWVFIDGVKLQNVKTLGQLRALLFAVGGE